MKLFKGTEILDNMMADDLWAYLKRVHMFVISSELEFLNVTKFDLQRKVISRTIEGSQSTILQKYQIEIK